MLELARPSDREAVNRIGAQVHALHIAWRPDLFAEKPEHFTQEYFQARIDARELFVAKLQGTVVGYICLSMENRDHPGVVPQRVMHLEEIGVDESLRGQGIGSQMVQEAMALGRAFGCTDVKLSVYPQNDAAVHFYQKCGFAIQHITMRRKL